MFEFHLPTQVMSTKKMALPLLAALLCVLYACDAGRNAVDDAAPQTLTEAVTLPNGMVLPAGTTLRDTKMPDGRSMIAFKLPEGHKLIGIRGGEGNDSSDSEELEEGGLTCSCVGGGCSPFRAYSTLLRRYVVGCAMDGCGGSCSMTTYAIKDMEPLYGVDIIDTERPLSLTASKEEEQSLSCPTPALLRSATVRRELHSYLQLFQRDHLSQLQEVSGPEDLPPGYEMVKLDLFGRLVRIPVQVGLSVGAFMQAINVQSEDYEEIEEGGAFRCRCLITGESGCVAKRSPRNPVGYIEYCEAGRCSSCRMD